MFFLILIFLFKRAFEKSRHEYSLVHQENKPTNSKKPSVPTESSKAGSSGRPTNNTPSTSRSKSTKAANKNTGKHSKAHKAQQPNAVHSANSNSSFSYEDDNDDNNTTTTTTNTATTNNQTNHENESNSAVNDDYEDELNYSDQQDFNRTLTPVKAAKKEENVMDSSSQETTKSPLKKTKTNLDGLNSSGNNSGSQSIVVPASSSPGLKTSPAKPLNLPPPPLSPPTLNNKPTIVKTSTSKGQNTTSIENSVKTNKNFPPQSNQALLSDAEPNRALTSLTNNFSIPTNNESLSDSSPFATHLQSDAPTTLDSFNSFLASFSNPQMSNPKTNVNSATTTNNNNVNIGSNLMPPPLVTAPGSHNDLKNSFLKFMVSKFILSRKCLNHVINLNCEKM